MKPAWPLLIAATLIAASRTAQPPMPNSMTTFWMRANHLMPNTTNRKAMMFATVAMTKQPHV